MCNEEIEIKCLQDNIAQNMMLCLQTILLEPNDDTKRQKKVSLQLALHAVASDYDHIEDMDETPTRLLTDTIKFVANNSFSSDYNHSCESNFEHAVEHLVCIDDVFLLRIIHRRLLERLMAWFDIYQLSYPHLNLITHNCQVFQASMKPLKKLRVISCINEQICCNRDNLLIQSTIDKCLLAMDGQNLRKSGIIINNFVQHLIDSCLDKLNPNSLEFINNCICNELCEHFGIRQ